MWNLRVGLSVLMVVGLSACPALVDWPGLGNPPVMDVVVGNMGQGAFKTVEDGKLMLPIDGIGDVAGEQLEQAKIVVYLDALNSALDSPSGQPSASLVLGIPEDPADESALSIGNPVDVEFDNGDLYVVDQADDRIYIWRDYRSHHNFDPPDVILLANVEEVQSPWELLITQNCLFLCDMYRGLLAWKDADAIQTGALPDVVVAPNDGEEGSKFLLGGSGPVSMLSGLEVDDSGNLYISWLSGGLFVYYDFVQEYLTNATIAPDVVLSGPSFNNMTSPIWKIHVANNVLYAHTHSSSSTLFVFSPADALENNQAPDAVITPTLGRLQSPFSMATAGNTLFVGNMSGDYVGVCGFRPADGLTMGQQPSVMLDYVRSAMGPCSNLCVEDNILFATSSLRPVCGKFAAFPQDLNVGNVHIFGHANRIGDGAQADIVIRGGLDFLVPLSIDAVAVDE